MEQIEDLIERRIGEALTALGYPDARVELRPHPEGTRRPEFGDYSTPVCLSLAKTARQNPWELAERLRAALVAAPIPNVGEVTVSRPGFVNVRVDMGSFAPEVIGAILQQGVSYGATAMAGDARGKVIIEHTNINSNKAAHIGHLRNACIGDTLARLLRATGRQVEVQNYVDDTGVQVADVVVGFQVLKPHYDESMPFDYFCSDVYAAINRRYESDPGLLEERKRVLREIEEGHNETAAFAKEMSLRIVKAHLATMARLGIGYDLLTWESDILALGFWRHAFEQLRDRGLLVHPASGPLAGCWVVPFDESSDGEDDQPDHANGKDGETARTADKVLVKSDGVATYTAKDIAYQLWKFGLLGLDFRYRQWSRQPDGQVLWTTTTETGPGTFAAGDDAPAFGRGAEVVNVIDARQSYLQQVVKESLRRLGYAEQSDRSIHLAYEVVTLSAASARDLGVDTPEGRTMQAMSGRRGIEIKADDLISTVERTVAAKAADERVAKALAAGAVRYYMLKFNLNQIIVFDVEEASRATGDTGVYVQYAYARACSILRRLGVDTAGTPRAIPEGAYAPASGYSTPLHPSERALVLKLAEFPKALRSAAERRSPSAAAQLAFQLASQLTDFIEHTPPIVREEDPLVKQFRTALVAATRQTLHNALDVLGIPAVEAI